MHVKVLKCIHLSKDALRAMQQLRAVACPDSMQRRKMLGRYISSTAPLAVPVHTEGRELAVQSADMSSKSLMNILQHSLRCLMTNL